VKPAVKRSALGYFKHEAVAVDPERGHLYLTEDEKDGCLYRFTPDNGLPDLSAGILEIAHVNDEQQVSWLVIEDACPHKILLNTRTRYQVPQATKFKGGEGIWYQKGFVIFSTKRDNRVWVLDVITNKLKVLYDAARTEGAILSGVDNVTAMPSGDILVAEDGGNMQLVSLDAQGRGRPIVQVVGQEGSEITGPAFSPNGKYLYFSSQRGKDAEQRLGITYQVWAS
jgi:secreted PhoX family phosphatase